MKEKKIIEPKQKRSIEKKNRIIEYGMQTMLTRGYHHTTTDDIAKALLHDCGAIRRMLISSINTTKTNTNN